MTWVGDSCRSMCTEAKRINQFRVYLLKYVQNWTILFGWSSKLFALLGVVVGEWWWLWSSLDWRYSKHAVVILIWRTSALDSSNRPPEVATILVPSAVVCRDIRYAARAIFKCSPASYAMTSIHALREWQQQETGVQENSEHKKKYAPQGPNALSGVHPV